MHVVIFGRGKLGRTLARQLQASEVVVTLRSARGKLGALPPAPHVLVLAVPDDQIAACAARLAPQVTRRSVVVHCAGARGPNELAACRAQGAAVAGFHPLVSFASKAKQANLRGATFVAHGDPRATRAARRLSRALDAHCLVLPILGPAYHAAAALLANGSVALAYFADAILHDLGMPPRARSRALAGLLTSVAFNLEHTGLPHALTGPVARGDLATVRAHLAALRAHTPRAARAYHRVLPLTIACAQAVHTRAPAWSAVFRSFADAGLAPQVPEHSQSKNRQSRDIPKPLTTRRGRRHGQ